MSARLRLNHLFDRWGIWAMVALCLGHTFTIAFVPALEGPLNWVMWPLMGLHALGMWFLSRHHERITCPTCWELFPVNPADRAARSARPALGAIHAVLWVADLQRRIPGMDARSAGIIASMGIIVAIVSVARIFIEPPWISVVLMLTVLFYWHSAQRHAQLQPWCPWCDHGGGEDEQPETPDPQPSTGRDLTPATAV